MSELTKLHSEFIKKNEKRQLKIFKDFQRAIIELQLNCKHEKTHWMQEIDREGKFKDGFFKRCFVCGATVDHIDVSDEEKEKLMQIFDEAAEKHKTSTDVPKKTTEGEK